MVKKSVIGFAFLLLALSITLVAAGTFTRNYNFVNQLNIEAFSCRLGPFPTQFPSAINAQACNREFLNITANSDLDYVDGVAYGGGSWTNYAGHHFFVLHRVNKTSLKRFDVQYVTKNKYQVSNENHYLYVRNFDSGQWELLASATVGYLQQGFLYYNSSNGTYPQYVNNGSMWFMGTEGATNGKAIATDSFRANLYSECQADNRTLTTDSAFCVTRI